MSAPGAMPTSKDVEDNLFLAGNPKIAKMLEKEGAEKGEILHFSDKVIKINKRGKEQERALMVTNKAVYNLKLDGFKCKRRIDMTHINAITSSKTSNEFVVHVPEEYDYRYKSDKKNKIFDILKTLVPAAHSAGGGNSEEKDEERPAQLVVATIDQQNLQDTVWTKAQARMASREAILRRKKQLMVLSETDEALDEKDKSEEAVESSKESGGQGEDQFTQLMKSTENVGLNDFLLLKVIGRGAFGKVMQVKKKDTGKVFAMKILKKKAIIQSNQVEHTIIERRILESLQHPFLMTLRYAFQSKEKLYFVLDYYNGGELFFHLKSKRRFSEDIARIYVAEVALALGHLHKHGVVYRDLKPENILLDDNGHVCLTDFGLAKDISDDHTHTFCGTPEYMAPEIVVNAGHNKAVDWWGLGILLYELTVGIPPFYHQNVNQMYTQIRHGVLRFPHFLSDECKNLIVGLLNRDPPKRLGSANDVEDIKAHPFFKKIDWKKMMKKEIDVPYKPEIKSDVDTSNFDETFTAEPVVDSFVPPSTLKNDDNNAFQNFTYVQKGGKDAGGDGLHQSQQIKEEDEDEDD